MSERPPLRSALLALLAGAVLLPVAICILLGTGYLLRALGDTSGGMALSRIALAGGILWALDLVTLLVLQVLSQLGG